MKSSVSGLRVETDAEGRLLLAGELTFDTAARALSEGSRALAGRAVTRLDLAGLQAIDSAGLACVLALKAEAVRLGGRLQVEHMPDGLRALAQVSDVEALLDAAA